MRERLRRAGVSIAQVCLAQRDTALLLHWELQADRVLVDAPCTGLGTSRRNPWFKLTLTEEDVLRMAHSQRAVLERYERLVKPGGRLVYATCTLLKKENEDIIDWFLNTYRDFSLVSAPDLLRAQGISVDSSRPFMTLYPSETGTDGFFAAVAVRNA
jgi:16S rRNA (cytosine967-C5)-methyltransferase